MPANFTKKLFSYFFEHEKIGEPMRYLLIGGTCGVLDLSLLYIQVEFFHIWYLAATIISFVTITTFGYFGQKYFTFRNKSKNYKKQMPIFFVIVGIGLLINTSCMFFFVSILQIWYIIANVITKFIVLIWNYFANKHITFSTK